MVSGATNVRTTGSQKRRKARQTLMIQAGLAAVVGIGVASILFTPPDREIERLSMEGPVAPILSVFPEAIGNTVERNADSNGLLASLVMYMPAAAFSSASDPFVELSAQFTARAPKLEGRELASRMDQIAELAFEPDEVRCPSYDVGPTVRIDGYLARRLTIQLNRGC